MNGLTALQRWAKPVNYRPRTEVPIRHLNQKDYVLFPTTILSESAVNLHIDWSDNKAYLNQTETLARKLKCLGSARPNKS